MPVELVFRHCPECGEALTPDLTQRIGPMKCLVCGRLIHLDPKVAAAGLLVNEDRVLLFRRAHFPKKDLWCLPGGYVDRGETVEEAAGREVFEETGLVAVARQLIGLYSYPGVGTVVAVFLMEILGGHLRASPESRQLMWMTRDQLPWDRLAFPSVKDALRWWVDSF